MIHKDFECELYLIRHGQSESNAQPGLLAGADFDSALTAKGEEQARLLGARFAAEGVSFDRIYSSTYQRAIRTARIMLTAMGLSETNVPEVHALREHEGPEDWRGKRMEEVFTPELRAYMAAKASDYKPLGGESVREVERRVSAWLEDELIYNQELVSRPVSMTVGIVGHGTANQMPDALHTGLRPEDDLADATGQLLYFTLQVRQRRLVAALDQRQRVHLGPGSRRGGRCRRLAGRAALVDYVDDRQSDLEEARLNCLSVSDDQYHKPIGRQMRCRRRAHFFERHRFQPVQEAGRVVVRTVEKDLSGELGLELPTR